MSSHVDPQFISEMPQYFNNDLSPVAIDKESLEATLKEFQNAVPRGIQLIRANCPAPNVESSKSFGNIYSGNIGIALVALRVLHQAKYLGFKDKTGLNNFTSIGHAFALKRINQQIPAGHPQVGRVSALGSGSLGAAVIRILAFATDIPSTFDLALDRLHSRDIQILEYSIRIACEQGEVRGGDDVLYGRAGLLNAILNIRELPLDAEDLATFSSVFERIPDLVDAIMSTGMLAAQDYLEIHGEREALPLMWPWHDKHYIGAIHGICGILTVLLSCKPEELGEGTSKDYSEIIAQTINALCELCISNNGHIPSSVPHHPSSHPSPLVQICHGAPGLLVLLSHARNNARFASTYWNPSWDKAISLASQRVWEQGLLYKGGGLCHGIAGNAWPMLMLHDAFEYGPQGNDADKEAFSKLISSSSPGHRLSGDFFLSRALAFLLQARKTQPFNTHTYADSIQYRMPDAPYSLFEGLAGNVCAWMEACVVISARLRKMDANEQPGVGSQHIEDKVKEDRSYELGMPGFANRGYL